MTTKDYKAIADGLVAGHASDFTIEEFVRKLRESGRADNFDGLKFYTHIDKLRSASA